MSYSDFLENALLDHWLGASSYSAPATVYIGLSSTTIADDGSNVTEPSAGAYARVAVTNNLTEWPAAAGGSKSNANQIDFPTATADWLAGADMVDFFIADAPSGGNILGFGTLPTPKPVLTDDQPFIGAGNLTVNQT